VVLGSAKSGPLTSCRSPKAGRSGADTLAGVSGRLADCVDAGEISDVLGPGSHRLTHGLTFQVTAAVALRHRRGPTFRFGRRGPGFPVRISAALPVADAGADLPDTATIVAGAMLPAQASAKSPFIAGGAAGVKHAAVAERNAGLADVFGSTA
jgi:hypothetical protein